PNDALQKQTRVSEHVITSRPGLAGARKSSNRLDELAKGANHLVSIEQRDEQTKATAHQHAPRLRRLGFALRELFDARAKLRVFALQRFNQTWPTRIFAHVRPNNTVTTARATGLSSLARGRECRATRNVALRAAATLGYTKTARPTSRRHFRKLETLSRAALG